ncbi:hypothetical protein BFJ66_g213 [Fusarium oxysporum f. sp. cepae]|uniref:F-box domain-containing protein n=1 Tax=Fusarium oxysporum f. sp. cepae TaxID=396571 RepID=A0A3L6NZA7_FUSOX|nr:hypothetical protein BFJ65_g3136 [Fusarium oxysporum f. sp. cepae]RKK59191.1 hypothetical protein BFJ67_g2721 [Fusarium oxysporum f. sp. cepae]RKK64321.1 hypothetical protein BFJ66_g213 [Fusarium oxysporum f. sp. cepae]
MSEPEPTALWLPDEVLFNILSTLQDSDDPDAISTKEANITLFNACLASRRLESLAQRVLYRCIDARSSKCLVTLGQNPHLCRLVRELYCPYDEEVVNALLHPHFRNYIWLPSSWSASFPNWLESEHGRQEYYGQATAFWVQRLPNLNRLTISLSYDMKALTEMVQKSLNGQPRRFPRLTRIDFKLCPSGIPPCIQPSLILFQLPFLKTVTIHDMPFFAKSSSGDLEMPKNACKRLERLDADFAWITPGSLRNLLSVCESLRFLDIKVRTMLSTTCDPFNYRLGDWIQHCHALESLDLQIKASRRWTNGLTGGREVQEQTWAANNIGSLQNLTRLKRFSLSVELRHLTVPGPSVPPPSPSKLDFELMLPTSIEQFEIRKIGIPDYKAFVRNIRELLQSKRLTNLFQVSVAAHLKPHHVAHPSWEVQLHGPGQFDKVLQLVQKDRKGTIQSSRYDQDA